MQREFWTKLSLAAGTPLQCAPPASHAGCRLAGSARCETGPIAAGAACTHTPSLPAGLQLLRPSPCLDSGITTTCSKHCCCRPLAFAVSQVKSSQTLLFNNSASSLPRRRRDDVEQDWQPHARAPLRGLALHGRRRDGEQHLACRLLKLAALSAGSNALFLGKASCAAGNEHAREGKEHLLQSTSRYLCCQTLLIIPGSQIAEKQ